MDRPISIFNVKIILLEGYKTWFMYHFPNKFLAHENQEIAQNHVFCLLNLVTVTIFSSSTKYSFIPYLMIDYI